MNPHFNKVLVVDDDLSMLRLLQKWVEAEGFDVRVATDGVEAIEQIKKDCPHFLLTDWEMPNMDGKELCQWLREQKLPQYVYTVLVTFRNRNDEVVVGLESGADDYMPKPVRRGELLARLFAGQRILELERRLSEMANTDGLTGLVVQRSFFGDLDREWERFSRHRNSLSAVMVDIDYFKKVNDTYGHPLGDQVIQEVAGILQNNCRATDVICRYGGEEFCALLPETDLESAAQWAERIRQQILDIRVPIGDGELKVSASFGVAEALDDTADGKTLIDMADQSLLVAKQSGRNRVVTFEQMAQSEMWQTGSDNGRAMLNGVTAKNVMTSIVASLHEDSPLWEAVQYFLRFRINSAPVVDDHGKLVGFLSEKDVMSVMLSPDWSEAKVSSIHKTDAVSFEEETSASVVYDFLCRVSLRSIVIVKDNVPTGVINRSSLLRWVSNYMETRSDPLSERVGQADYQSDAEVEASMNQSLSAITSHIRKESDRLDETNEKFSNEVLPIVVSGASRIQELAIDLLAFSKQLNQTNQGGVSET